MRWLMKVPRTVYWLALIGVLMRLPFIPIIGFKQDFLYLVSWAEYLVKSSPITIYADVEQLAYKFVNYPPLYLFVLTGLARIYRALCSLPFDHTAFLCLIKSVTVFFELAGAGTMFFWASKKWGRKAGIWAFALYFLNPAILYVSVYYGQLDAIFSAFLLLAIVAWTEERPLFCGAALALSLMMKLQTLPFLPLFFCFPLLQRKLKPLFWMAAGFAAVCGAFLSPYLLGGQIHALMYECVQRSFQWGKFVSVGAFNIWYLHADPMTFDGRIWGMFFSPDGILHTNAILNLLTYKNLGVALFGCAFLTALFHVWKQKDESGAWIAVMHVALAFFMLPTKVHERYLFPYFIFAAPLAARNGARLFFFLAFSATYLANVMAICPLFGSSVDVREIDSILGVAVACINVLLYASFIAYEYIIPYFPDRRFVVMTRTIFITLVCGVAVLFWRSYERRPDPYVLYLSELTPVMVEQDWPLLNEKGPRAGYEQLQADLSTDGRQLQIGNTVFRYGLGAHAVSRVEYKVPGCYQIFECYIGVDVEAMDKYLESPDVATMTFTVWTEDQDGNFLPRDLSPLTIPTSPPRKVTIPLAEKPNGTNRILLVVDGLDNIDSDHADWAMARVVRVTPYAP